MIDLKLKSWVIFVSDIQKMTKFYSETLGLEIEMDFGPNVGFTNGLALWQVQENHLLNSQDLVQARNKGSFEIYFEYDDIPALISRLKQDGVIFAHELHEETWGQYTTRFFDPEENLIEVGEPLSSLVKRLQAKGMNPGSITSKTSIPEIEVKRLLSL